MNNYKSVDDGSSSGVKTVITVVIIVLIVLGLGFYLFKISPQEQQAASTGYNGLVKVNSGLAALSAPPAFDPSVDHYTGDPKAKNVFIEYGDMQCPYCAAYNPMLRQISTQFPDTVFVFRYFPLLQHQNTIEASLAAEAAGAQGKFWEMHDLLFQKQSDWENTSDPLDTFAQYAQQVGVSDINKFKSDVTGDKYLQPMQTGEDQATQLNLQGTPTYFFNGHSLPVEANATIDGLKQQASQYLNK
jgi:protein-disulfide isomerase